MVSTCQVGNPSAPSRKSHRGQISNRGRFLVACDKRRLSVKGRTVPWMRVRWLAARFAAAGLVAAALFTPVAAARACSIVSAPHIDDLVPGEVVFGEDQVLGVYEFEFVARSPNLVVTLAQSVSVVTRYWGTPPPRTGLQRQGGTWELFFG